MKVKIKKEHPGAIIPKYATSGAACFDLHAIVEEKDLVNVINGKEFRSPDGIYVGYNSPVVFNTGLSFEIPEGHVMLIYSRSGHGYKYGVRLANCVGVVDSDYRGIVSVKLQADIHSAGLFVKHGDRIAQGMIVPVDRVEFEEVEELGTTERGTGGFGSTGR